MDVTELTLVGALAVLVPIAGLYGKLRTGERLRIAEAKATAAWRVNQERNDSEHEKRIKKIEDELTNQRRERRARDAKMFDRLDGINRALARANINGGTK